MNGGKGSTGGTPGHLPKKFRAMSPAERRRYLLETLKFTPDLLADAPQDYLDMADVMVENAVGIMGIPLGIAPGFLIDGTEYAVPMATEEPSVIAAAAYAAGIIKLGGGFTTSASEPVMTYQVFYPAGGSFDTESWIREHVSLIEDTAKTSLRSLEARGGGFRALRIENSGNQPWFKIEVDADVRDAMGANRLNGSAEALADFIEGRTGVRRIMAILSNSSAKKTARASFVLPFPLLGKIRGNAEETARRIVLADSIAAADSDRAVTHNKGIMNGVSALALATGNDTRAAEAAVHGWAAKDGSYRGLTRYAVDSDCLTATLEIPTAFAAVGGATGFHPTAKVSLELLGNPDAQELSRIAAALGLAQNFAALLALTGDGIQKGHMLKHARKTAFLAGARGCEIDRAAAEMHGQKEYSLEAALRILGKTEP